MVEEADWAEDRQVKGLEMGVEVRRIGPGAIDQFGSPGSRRRAHLTGRLLSDASN